jgi:hypothetical protein
MERNVDFEADLSYMPTPVETTVDHDTEILHIPQGFTSLNTTGTVPKNGPPERRQLYDDSMTRKRYQRPKFVQ